jgi:hypothetical protein
LKEEGIHSSSAGGFFMGKGEVGRLAKRLVAWQLCGERRMEAWKNGRREVETDGETGEGAPLEFDFGMTGRCGEKECRRFAYFAHLSWPAGTVL